MSADLNGPSTNDANSTRTPAALVLEDGSVFSGHRIGDHGDSWGEVVFNTSMTGYQEMLTDPSYSGQILVLTYPLIGNYGIEPRIDESAKIQVRGLVVRSDCETPSHPHGGVSLDAHLLTNGMPGLAGIDTRAVTRRLRSQGVMQGMIVDPADVEQAQERLSDVPSYESQDFIDHVGTARPYEWADGVQDLGSTSGEFRIVVLDEGLKFNIARELRRRGCQVSVLPPTATVDEIQALEPDGVMLSPGPGDPQLRDSQVAVAKALLGTLPMMGICLGHQVIGRALGADTFKLKFGHRGGNHPVKDLRTGRVYITAQNHGYAVEAKALDDGAVVSHVNLHDGTVAGLTHRDYPVVSIQYHSEAAPGPLDNGYLFDEFLDLVRDWRSKGSAE